MHSLSIDVWDGGRKIENGIFEEHLSIWVRG
jgi:hypothetical protein